MKKINIFASITFYSNYLISLAALIYIPTNIFFLLFDSTSLIADDFSNK